MTANMMHLLPLNFRFQLSSGKTILSAVFRVNLESARRVPKTQSIFHLCAQRNAFHRGARQQSTSFARLNPRHVADPVDCCQVLRDQKKLSCVWIFHDGPGRKIGNIDILSLIRCIRTRDHAFPAWDRNSIGQTSLCFFHIRG